MAEDQTDDSQKTEEPTEKRLRDAREKGQVALSSEFMASIGLCVGMLLLAVAGGSSSGGLGTQMDSGP